MIIYIALSIIIITAFHILFIRKQKKKIKKLRNYVTKMNDGEYNLDISDNREGEFSKLKNELYKTEVTLKEVAEKTIQEKEKLSNSLADISHQLKTPLTSISILLDNINDNPQMDEKTRMEFLKDISQQVEWTNSLVISLLKLAKFDANVIVFDKREIIITELIDDVLEKLAVLIELKNITVDTSEVDKFAKFTGDYNWEVEAISNIIKNAIEHSKDDSRIIIKAEDNNLFLKLIIMDSGEGISIEDKKHIFERFYKSKNSKDNSIGIGLPLAKEILKKDNGYIYVDSIEGKGTKFEIKYMK